MRPVIVAAGGTGGHVVPALAVADVLDQRDVPVIWLGTRSGLESRLVPAAGIDIRWIGVAGLRGKGLRDSLLGPLKLLRSCVQCMRLMASLKPRAVLGMGGFVSGPAGIAALLMRKPLVLHEQNAVAGMTNRWLGRFATRVFSAWSNVFPAALGAEAVGNPVHRDIALRAQQAAERLDTAGQQHADDTLRVLVVGGSRGAAILNMVVPEAVTASHIKLELRHQCGAGNLHAVQMAYANAGSQINVTVDEFIDDMAQAYAQADLVICRAGAMTITELSALGMPSLLIPFPHAVDDHQTRNARRLSDAGAAVLMPQTEFDANTLVQHLTRLHKDRAALGIMAIAAVGQFQAGAAERVADALMEVSI